MASHVDNSALRQAPTSTELALLLRKITREIPIERVTNRLLAAVKSEALPPDIFAIYLTTVGSPAAVISALQQPFSRFVRHAAIKQFGWTFKRPDWELVWDEFGGTKGIIHLLSGISVLEVDYLCRVIGWAAPSPTDRSLLKQQRATELLKELLPQYRSENSQQSQEDRPLKYRYAHLLPACTTDFIKELIGDWDGGPFGWDPWPIRRIAQSHWPMLQDFVVATLKSRPDEESGGPDLIERFLPHLLHNIPPIAGHVKGFSAPMSFSLKVLRIIEQGNERYFDQNQFTSLLIMPLLRRALSRKTDLQALQEILDLALSYLQKHPKALSELRSWNEMSFFACVAKSWSTKSRAFEKHLIATIEFQSVGTADALPEIEETLKVIDRRDRFDLLRLIILHGAIWKADIDNDFDLRKLPIRQWPLSIFQSMSSKNANDFLLRLIRLKPEGDFLQLPKRAPSYSILGQPPLQDQHHGDPLLLSILLSCTEKNHGQDPRRSVERHQERSVKGRDQSLRAFHAKSACFYAIASGSLVLYDQVMMWSRRYVRDPLTLKEIYGCEAIMTKEGIALLSGIPRDLSHHEASDVRGLVTKGNKVLINILETAILTLDEPSFNSRDWDSARIIFRKIVAVRIEETCRLKNALRLTEESVYSVLWESTLDMLLKVEKLGLQKGHESLCFNDPMGPLSEGLVRGGLPGPRAFSIASYRFFDNLAKARNDIWMQHRPTVLSDCATLPSGWPRGLPIQALIASFTYGIQEHAAKTHTPYIFSRSAAIVFLKHNPIIDNISEDMRAAIGGFIDEYEAALRINILQQKPGNQQQDQASAIVSHFMSLCCNSDPETRDSRRLSYHEAVQTYKKVFQQARLGFRIAAIDQIDELCSKRYPMLPVNFPGSNSHERLEWNPIERISQPATLRQVPSTLLDYMIDAGHYRTRRTFAALHVSAITPGYTNVFATKKILRIKQEGRAVEEGTVVSALLFLESRLTPPIILTSAFPSMHDIRYPPLFLEQEFLEDSRMSVEMAQQALLHLRQKVPSTLLHALSENAIDALSNPALRSAESSSRNQTAYGLLRLLSQSDRLESAVKGVLTTLIDRPEASSWHRQLLTKSFLQRLSRPQAQLLLDSLTSSIHAKLDEQSRLREMKRETTHDQTTADSSSPTKPIIKITTIKSLAQFLNDSDVISTNASIQMLTDILLKSSHLDIQFAVIESMVSKLEMCKYDDDAEELEDQVFQAVEKCIPKMASFDECHVLEEEDWQLAEQAGDLPKVNVNGSFYEKSPMLSTLCSVPWSAELSTTQNVKLLDRVILPAISRSQANHGRWMGIFAKKFDLEHSHQLPALPIHPQVLSRLLETYFLNVPSWILGLNQNHALTNLNPSTWLVAFNKKLRNSPGLRDSNAVEHWRLLFDKGPDLIKGIYSHLSDFLKGKSRGYSDGETKRRDLIRQPYAQKCLVEQASALLWLQDPDFTRWNQFISCLGPPLNAHDSSDEKSAWLASSKTVLQQIIAMVDGLRGSKDLQRSPGRTKLLFFPSSFPLRLLLLDYPQLYPQSSVEDNVTRFSEQILKLLREVQNLGMAHREKLAEIAGAAVQTPREVKILVACSIGEVAKPDDSRDEEEIELATELADKLLQVTTLDGLEKEEVTALLKSWVQLEIEGVRMRGVRAARRLGLDIEDAEEQEVGQ